MRRTEFHAMKNQSKTIWFFPQIMKTTKRDEFFSASRRTGSDALKRFAQLLIALDLLGKYRDATDDFGSFGSFMQIAG